LKEKMTKIAYLDCACGISGDMTLAALVDAGVSLDALNAAIATLGLPGLRLKSEEVHKQGFRATQIVVEHEPEHEHRNLTQILKLIDAGQLTTRQKDIAKRIFRRLAEAEALVHGVAIEKIHFHEVGAADSIADIVGSAIAFDMLGVDRIVASPVPTGSGRVKIMHGECSIPAPATAELLRGIPIAASSIEGELTTPTGAAILATIVDSFGPIPGMKIERIGYGAGQRDYPQRPNILRLLAGEEAKADLGDEAEQICLLETNLDDTHGELVGYCIARLWDAGALDVTTTAIGMKKSRPGVMLSVLCQPGDAEKMEDILFSETCTLGVRCTMVARHVLRRQPRQVSTPWGPVEGQVSWLRNGSMRFSPEFESCRITAAAHQVPLRDVYETAQKAFEEKGTGKGEREPGGDRRVKEE
jgi:pyridinium-3,5-bisthiocarboxylic acid mononucleotide nickel chelatase